jgi:hypothetical protein
MVNGEHPCHAIPSHVRSEGSLAHPSHPIDPKKAEGVEADGGVSLGCDKKHIMPPRHAAHFE